VVFGRWANTLCVDGTPAPAIDPKFDWECELGVVIGRRMFRVDKEQGLKGVFGYCAFNDLSARTFQLQTPQWTLGKNSAASGPMSEIVTSDVTGDPGLGLRICTRVNGETMQDSTTADMIFSVGELVAHLSQALILEPGDLIVTGTPSGVGMARGKFLKAGDVVEVEIEKIGVVRTPIIALPEPIF
jgi:2,4-diketo-3-deoxy-L-fuconate hydrolase